MTNKSPVPIAELPSPSALESKKVLHPEATPMSPSAALHVVQLVRQSAAAAAARAAAIQAALVKCSPPPAAAAARPPRFLSNLAATNPYTAAIAIAPSSGNH